MQTGGLSITHFRIFGEESWAPTRHPKPPFRRAPRACRLGESLRVQFLIQLDALGDFFLPVAGFGHGAVGAVCQNISQGTESSVTQQPHNS